MQQFFAAVNEAATDDAVAGVIVTGSGKYYSAGVDLSAMIKPMAPSKLIRQIRDSNETVFRTFLDFPKPIVAAVNGPAIGAAVTTQTLMDAIIASERATFSLPFAKLGVPPEGCSSVIFPERMGEETAQRMLGNENWIPTAAEAKAAGLIDEVVAGDGVEALEARAAEVLRERIAAGGGRRYDTAECDRLKKVNADESATLANAFVSPKFLNGQSIGAIESVTPSLASCRPVCSRRAFGSPCTGSHVRVQHAQEEEPARDDLLGGEDLAAAVATDDDQAVVCRLMACLATLAGERERQ